MAEIDSDNELSAQDAFAADLDAALNGKPDEVSEEEALSYAKDGERVRDESGRFAKKEAKAETIEAASVDATTETPQPAKSQWRPLWHKNEMGEWEQLPEPLRKAIEQREREAAQGIEKHSTAAKAWEPVTQLLAPHMAELQASGVSPQQYVSSLVSADKYLREDPVAAMNWLAQLYTGTDLYGLVQWMQDQQYQPEKTDPLMQEVQQLKQQLEDLRQLPVRQQREHLQTEITNWAKDKPYFGDLREYMAALAQTPQYKQATLDQLYEAAQYAHPELRERILADQRKREVTEARARGAQSPRGASDEGAQPRKPKRQSIEADVKAAFDEAGL